MTRTAYYLLGGGLIIVIGLLVQSHAAQAAEAAAPSTPKSGQTDGPGSNLTNPPESANSTVIATQNLSAEVLIPGYGLPINDPDFKVGRNMTEPT